MFVSSSASKFNLKLHLQWPNYNNNTNDRAQDILLSITLHLIDGLYIEIMFTCVCQDNILNFEPFVCDTFILILNCQKWKFFFLLKMW